jgi:hypothetical protein
VLITETEPKKFRREVSVPFTGIMYVRNSRFIREWSEIIFQNNKSLSITYVDD